MSGSSATSSRSPPSSCSRRTRPACPPSSTRPSATRRVREFHNRFSAERREVLVELLREGVKGRRPARHRRPRAPGRRAGRPDRAAPPDDGPVGQPRRGFRDRRAGAARCSPSHGSASTILLTTRVQLTILRWQARPMGDLEVDSAVEPVDGRHAAVRRPALARTGRSGDRWVATSPRSRPGRWLRSRRSVVRPRSAATTSAWPLSTRCRSRSVPLRAGRQAASHRVSRARRASAPILEALVWSVADAPGLEHDLDVAPDVPGPDELPSVQELAGPDAAAAVPVLEQLRIPSACPGSPDWPPPGPLDPIWQTWLRLLEWNPGADPWLDAARSLLLVDLPSWPSGSRPHAWSEPSFIAPTLDVSASFHRLAAAEPWLLVEGTSPVATDALMGWTARLWTTTGLLVASGGGQTLFRPIPG